MNDIKKYLLEIQKKIDETSEKANAYWEGYLDCLVECLDNIRNCLLK